MEPDQTTVDEGFDAATEYFRRTWWQHVAGFAIAGPGLVLLGWDVVDRAELARVGVAWLVLTIAMAGVFCWATLDADRVRSSIVVPLSVAAPKVVLGSSLLLVPSGRYSLEFLYLLTTVLFGVAAGTTITLGPIYRLSSTAMYACFVPLAFSLLLQRQWIMLSALVAFLVVLVAVALTRLAAVYVELGEMRGQLAERAEKAEEDARTDWLTGLLNRQGLESVVAELPTDRSVGSIYVDLDGFKLLNDTYGHEAGDIALREVASSLRRAVRTGDVVARLGGDEFVVLVSDVSATELGELADRILTRLTDLRLEFGRDRVAIHASLGLALDEPGVFELASALQMTDAALYAAKRGGRNRAVWSGESSTLDLSIGDISLD